MRPLYGLTGILLYFVRILRKADSRNRQSKMDFYCLGSFLEATISPRKVPKVLLTLDLS